MLALPAVRMGWMTVGDAPGIPSENLRRCSLQSKKRKRKCVGERFGTRRQWVGTGPLRYLSQSTGQSEVPASWGSSSVNEERVEVSTGVGRRDRHLQMNL